jgi:hypothetical protein
MVGGPPVFDESGRLRGDYLVLITMELVLKALAEAKRASGKTQFLRECSCCVPHNVPQPRVSFAARARNCWI